MTSDQQRDRQRRIAELMQYGIPRGDADEIAAIELGEITSDIVDSPESRRRTVITGPSLVEEFGLQDAGDDQRKE